MIKMMRNQTFEIKETLLASKGKRLGNFLIDYIIQYLLMTGFGYVIFFISEMTASYGLYNLIIQNDSFLTNYIIGAFILILYYIINEGLTKRSLGKFITQTKVVMIDGSEPKFRDILIRTLCRLIPFEMLSFLGVNGKGWHDQLSNTYVVNAKEFDDSLRQSMEIDSIGKLPE